MASTRTTTEPLERHELSLTASQRGALKILADRRDCSMNELIRRAVDAYLVAPEESSQ